MPKSRPKSSRKAKLQALEEVLEEGLCAIFQRRRHEIKPSYPVKRVLIKVTIQNLVKLLPEEEGIEQTVLKMAIKLLMVGWGTWRDQKEDTLVPAAIQQMALLAKQKETGGDPPVAAA